MRFRFFKSYLFWLGIVLPAVVLARVSILNNNWQAVLFVISTYVFFSILIAIIDKQVGPRDQKDK